MQFMFNIQAELKITDDWCTDNHCAQSTELVKSFTPGGELLLSSVYVCRIVIGYN